MRTPSARLEARRREEWRRLNGDVERLARDAGSAARVFVSRHPLAALGSCAAVGLLVASTVRGRPGSVDPRPRKKRRLATTLGRLLRTSLNGALATLLQDVMPPRRRDVPSPGPSSD